MIPRGIEESPAGEDAFLVSSNRSLRSETLLGIPQNSPGPRQVCDSKEIAAKSGERRLAILTR